MICHICGQRIQQHSVPEWQSHVTVWLADPDTTVEQVLAWTAGMLVGCSYRALTDPHSVQATLNVYAAAFGDAVQRRTLIDSV